MMNDEKSKPKFSILTQITRQKRKLATINRQIDLLSNRWADEEKKLAKLYEQLEAKRRS